MRCPRCDALQSDDARQCECGYDFFSRSVRPSDPVRHKRQLRRIAEKQFASGFAAGFFGVCVGWVLVQVLSKEDRTRKGANWGLLTILAIFLARILSAAAFGR